MYRQYTEKVYLINKLVNVNLFQISKYMFNKCTFNK